MMKNLIAFLVLTSVLTGCKLVQQVPAGGSISSVSGNHNCPENATCQIEVTAGDFDEVFFAIPEDGYKFVQWSQDSVCTDKQNPICPASNVGYEGNPAVTAIINSNAEYVLRPIFTTTITGQTTKRVVRDANGVLIGEIVDITLSRARVLADYTAQDGAQYTFLLSVGLNFIEPVFSETAPPGQPDRLFFGDSSCSLDDLWVNTFFDNPTGRDIVSPLLTQDALVTRQGTNALGEPVWSVVRYTDTVAGFVPFGSNSSGTSCGSNPASIPVPMRKVELVESDWLGTFAKPYSFVRE